MKENCCFGHSEHFCHLWMISDGFLLFSGLRITSFTSTESSFEHMLCVHSNSLQMSEEPYFFFFSYLSQLSNYFLSLEKRIKELQFLKPLFQFECEYCQITAESLHFKPILII